MNIFKKTRKFLSALRDLASWREKDFRKAGVDNRHAAERVEAALDQTRESLCTTQDTITGYVNIIEGQRAQLKAIRHDLRVIEGLTCSHFMSITDIDRIHKLADDGLDAIKK